MGDKERDVTELEGATDAAVGQGSQASTQADDAAANAVNVADTGGTSVAGDDDDDDANGAEDVPA